MVLNYCLRSVADDLSNAMSYQCKLHTDASKLSDNSELQNGRCGFRAPRYPVKAPAALWHQHTASHCPKMLKTYQLETVDTHHTNRSVATI